MRQILNRVWRCSFSCLLRLEVIRKIVKIAFPSRKVVASGSLVCNRGVYYVTFYVNSFRFNPFRFISDDS